MSNEISKQDIINIRSAIQDVVADVGKKFGVMISVGRGKYGPTGELKLEISRVNADGIAETADMLNFRTYAHLFGLKPEDLHETFVHRGREFKIIGLNPRAHKNSIIVKSDKKEYVFPAEAVARLLEQKRKKS